MARDIVGQAGSNRTVFSVLISFICVEKPQFYLSKMCLSFFALYDHPKTGICAIFYLKTVMLLTKLYIVKKQNKKTSDKLFEKQQNHQCLPLRYVQTHVHQHLAQPTLLQPCMTSSNACFMTNKQYNPLFKIWSRDVQSRIKQVQGNSKSLQKRLDRNLLRPNAVFMWSLNLQWKVTKFKKFQKWPLLYLMYLLMRGVEL